MITLRSIIVLPKSISLFWSKMPARLLKEWITNYQEESFLNFRDSRKNGVWMRIDNNNNCVLKNGH